MRRERRYARGSRGVGHQHQPSESPWGVGHQHQPSESGLETQVSPNEGSHACKYDVAIRDNGCEFDGSRLHFVQHFRGTRISLVYYTCDQYARAPPALCIMQKVYHIFRRNSREKSMFARAHDMKTANSNEGARGPQTGDQRSTTAPLIAAVSRCIP